MLRKQSVEDEFLSRHSQVEKIGKEIFPSAPGVESKVMTSSPSENTWPIAAAVKVPKTSAVKQECQGDKGKQKLNPDRSDKTSNEQTLAQNSEKELRKKEQELQEKEKEKEKLKREKENAQQELQQQDQENKTLTTRINELEKEIERLNAEIIKLKKELKNLKGELDKIKGNQHYLLLAAMCDQLQKNFYQIVFYPYDFSKEKQSYKEKEIENDINEGLYGLTTDEKKRQARERWTDLKKKLGWNRRRHVKGIVRLKNDRNCTAHPEITKDMKESLEDGANALNHERELDEPTFGIVQNLIEMWLKTEDLVQKQEEKKNKEQTA